MFFGDASFNDWTLILHFTICEQISVRPRKKKTLFYGPHRPIFAHLWEFFFFKHKIQPFSGKKQIKNHERSEQEKNSNFSANFVKKSLKKKKKLPDRPTAFWNLFTRRTGVFLSPYVTLRPVAFPSRSSRRISFPSKQGLGQDLNFWVCTRLFYWVLFLVTEHRRWHSHGEKVEKLFQIIHFLSYGNIVSWSKSLRYVWMYPQFWHRNAWNTLKWWFKGWKHWKMYDLRRALLYMRAHIIPVYCWC